MGANTDGSEKLKLFVVEKFQNPRCFKGVATVAVEYTSYPKAWMMQEKCINWLKGVDKKISKMNGN